MTLPVVLTIAGQPLRIAAPDLANALRQRAGEVRSAGIRPEEWQLAKDGLAARVEHVEFLGHETILYAAAGDQRLVVRFPGAFELAAGDQLRLSAGTVHLFDEGGARVE